MTKEEAVSEFRRLVTAYGLSWCADVPAQAYVKLKEVSQVLSPLEMRAALTPWG